MIFLFLFVSRQKERREIITLAQAFFDLACYPRSKHISSLAFERASGNRLKYNGKELQSYALNARPLDWYDYGARMYDPVLGRWHSVDPSAEMAYSWTPYRYGFNNPIRFLDADGRFELDNAQQYSRLAHYLEHTIGDLLSNQRIMRPLMGYGDLTHNQIAKDFEWGKGPKIIIVDDLYCNGLSSYGCYDPDTRNVIYIDKGLALQLENALSGDIDAALLWLISRILHEYVHFGDWTYDNEAKEYEAGDAFEEWAYGITIDYLKDARKIIEKYNQRQEQNRKQEEENKKKKNSLNDLLNNLDNVEEGEYKWNGSEWVRQ